MHVHIDVGIEIHRGMTSELGRLLRLYKSKVCSHFHTQESPEEHRRRLRRIARQEDQGEHVVIGVDNRRSRTVKKEYSDRTYKHHALGDYPDMIIRLGAIPSLSSQTVWSFYLFPFAC